MLHSATRLARWSGTAYVCLACRHQRGLFVSQRRNTSDLQASPEAQTQASPSDVFSSAPSSQTKDQVPRPTVNDDHATPSASPPLQDPANHHNGHRLKDSSKGNKPKATTESSRTKPKKDHKQRKSAPSKQLHGAQSNASTGVSSKDDASGFVEGTTDANEIKTKGEGDARRGTQNRETKADADESEKSIRDAGADKIKRKRRTEIQKPPKKEEKNHIQGPEKSVKAGITLKSKETQPSSRKTKEDDDNGKMATENAANGPGTGEADVIARRSQGTAKEDAADETTRGSKRRRRRLKLTKVASPLVVRKCFVHPSKVQPKRTLSNKRRLSKPHAKKLLPTQGRSAKPDIAQPTRVTTKKQAARAVASSLIAHEARTITGEKQPAPVDVLQPPIPRLAHGLDRVLFNPGIYQLQDPYSNVYNFDPYLEKIMPVEEFDFGALREYKTSSEDNALANLARARSKRYMGSTSSMTGVLSQFHFLLSHFRHISLDMLSRAFRPESVKFTNLVRAPQSIYLRWQNGAYAIDMDKEYDSPNILMMLGRSMEKLLSMPKDDFERFRRGNPEGTTDSEKSAEEPYQYTEHGDFMMRSQLDTFDPRLPRNGTFDLKTRSVKSIRMDSANKESWGYELVSLRGNYQSYEREYFDMLRATMLKYMLQVRMGRMEGIFVAYHNIERIFGFQYITLTEIDQALHGEKSTRLGNLEFSMSLTMLNDLLNRATERFPEQSLRILFETDGDADSADCQLNVFAEPVTEEQIHEIQGASKERMAEFERNIFASTREGEIASSRSEGTGTAAEPRQEEDAQSVPPETDDSHPTEARKAVSTDESVSVDAAEPTSLDSGTRSTSASKSTSDDDMPAADAVATETGTNTGSTCMQVESAAAVVDNAATDDSAEAATPLFAAIVVVQSTVNGKKVLRPSSLEDGSHKWAVKYSIHEYPESQLGRARKAYFLSKNRRRKALMPAPKEGQTTADGQTVSPKEVDRYLSMLRKMAEEGRRYREMKDKEDHGKTIKVWQPSTSG